MTEAAAAESGREVEKRPDRRRRVQRGRRKRLSVPSRAADRFTTTLCVFAGDGKGGIHGL